MDQYRNCRKDDIWGAGKGGEKARIGEVAF